MITIVGKTSIFHVREVLRVTPEENLAMIADTVAYLRSQGRRVLHDAEHFFDGWKLDADYAAQTIVAAARAGAETVILCDTNGGSMPEEIARLTTAAIQAFPCRSASIATTTASWRWPIRWPRSTPARCKSRER